jgi:heme/copper-type cytochrome/quinol oxidase subunit 3
LTRHVDIRLIIDRVILFILYYLCSLVQWNRISIRECSSLYLFIGIILSIITLGFILSESLFFITFFSTIYSMYCYSLTLMEGIIISDPYSLSYINTILLSNSGLFIGYCWISQDIYFYESIYGMISAIMFLGLQIKEFYNINLYMNESFYITVFFSLIGLHLFHIILGVYFLSTQTHSMVYPTYMKFLVIPMYEYRFLLIVYWHFVDCLWLIIYYMFSLW